MNRDAMVVSIGDAARLLKISRSTVHRMCENGMVPYIETAGGHRRLKLSDINSVMQQLRGHAAETRVQPSLADTASCNRHLTSGEIADFLTRAEGQIVLRWLITIAGDSMLRKLEMEILGAIMELDARLLAGAITDAQMSLAFATLRSILDKCVASIDLPEAATTSVGGSPTDDRQGLGLRYVQIGLRLSGVRPVNLGGMLSPELLVKVAVEMQANSVWISHTHVSHPTNVIQWHLRLAALLPQSVRVIIGGGALSPLLRRQLPPHTFYESLASLVAGEVRPQNGQPHPPNTLTNLLRVATPFHSVANNFT